MASEQESADLVLVFKFYDQVFNRHEVEVPFGFGMDVNTIKAHIVTPDAA